jgi:hypothetical protein
MDSSCAAPKPNPAPCGAVNVSGGGITLAVMILRAGFHNLKGGANAMTNAELSWPIFAKHN